MTIKDFFNIRELVCPDTYNKHKDNSWQFIDNRLLSVLLWLRQGIGKPITINTWHKGGSFSQRGLRCNLCSLVADKTKKGILYLSAHQQGMAVDLDVAGMTADQVRKWIDVHQSSLPCPIRLESGVTWVHIDVRNTGKGKIEYFKG